MPGVTGLYGRRASLEPDPPGAPAPLGVNASTRPGGGDFMPDAAAAAALPEALFCPLLFLLLDLRPDLEPDFAPDAGPPPPFALAPFAFALAGVLKFPPFLLRTPAAPADLTCLMLAAVATALGLTLPPAAPPFFDDEDGGSSAGDTRMAGVPAPWSGVSVRGLNALGTKIGRGAKFDSCCCCCRCCI